jgi:hypothetical protein
LLNSQKFVENSFDYGHFTPHMAYMRKLTSQRRQHTSLMPKYKDDFGNGADAKNTIWYFGW